MRAIVRDTGHFLHVLAAMALPIVVWQLARAAWTNALVFALTARSRSSSRKRSIGRGVREEVCTRVHALAGRGFSCLVV